MAGTAEFTEYAQGKKAMRLGRQYLVLILVLLLVSTLVNSALNNYAIKDALSQRQQDWAETLARSLSEGLARDIIERRQLSLRDTLVRIADDSVDVNFAYVTDFDGKVLAHSFSNGFPKMLLPSTDRGSQTELENHRHVLDGVPILEVGYPIISGMHAHLYLGIEQKGNTQILAQLSRTFTWVAALIGLVGLMLSVWLTRRITQPLYQLTENVARYGVTGTMPSVIDAHSCTEVQQLQTIFWEMAVARQRDVDTLQQFKQTLDQTLDCVFMFDGETLRFTYMNQGALNQVGYRQDELLQMYPYDIKPDVTEAQFKQLIAPLLAGDQQQIHFETVHQHKNGQRVPVDISLQYIKTPNHTTHFIAVVHDVTQRKQAEMQLKGLNDELEIRVQQRTAELNVALLEAESANAAKTEFLSRMSHELRTPLNALVGFSHLLQTDPEQPLTKNQAENLREIQLANEHLLIMINEMLELSCIESGVLEVQLESIALASVIEESMSQLKPLAAQRGIQFTFERDACGAVQADRVRLQTVLGHLLSNAVKYNCVGGAVRVRCIALDTRRVRVSVQDNGQGIATADLPRLFKPFERLESAYTGIGGAGIGLALSKKIIEAMQGAIGVESTPGKGSTFWFELPMAEMQVSVTSTSEASLTTPQDRYRLLYIEDNPANLRLVQKILARRKDIEFLEAVNGETGLLVAEARLPDLILLDINLPGIDGFEVLRLLQENPRTQNIPVIALSANAMNRDVERGKEAGFNEYLTKPVEVARLLSLAERMLSPRQPQNDQPSK